MIAIFHLERGIPSKRKSSTCIEYVPALCTHRPSLLPIEWFNKLYEPMRFDDLFHFQNGKYIEFDHLEEVKVVTRFS